MTRYIVVALLAAFAVSAGLLLKLSRKFENELIAGSCPTCEEEEAAAVVPESCAAPRADEKYRHVPAA